RARGPARCTLLPYTTLFRSRTEDVEHLHQQPAHGAADSRTEQTEQAALQQEYPQDLPAGAAHGAQDADLPGALHNTDRQHAGDADRKSTRLNSSHVKISYAV